MVSSMATITGRQPRNLALSIGGRFEDIKFLRAANATAASRPTR
jgi:hypothetical protein